MWMDGVDDALPLHCIALDWLLVSGEGKYFGSGDFLGIHFYIYTSKINMCVYFEAGKVKFPGFYFNLSNRSQESVSLRYLKLPPAHNSKLIPNLRSM